MKRHNKALIVVVFGVVLLAVGIVRLLMPLSALLGTIQTNCGNAVAYFGNQDNTTTFDAIRPSCSGPLRLAGGEGIGLAIIGVIFFVVGLVFFRRSRSRTRRVDYSRNDREVPQFGRRAEDQLNRRATDVRNRRWNDPK